MRIIPIKLLLAILVVVMVRKLYANELTAISYSHISNQSDNHMLEFGSVSLSFLEQPSIVEQGVFKTKTGMCLELFCPRSSVSRERIQEVSSFSNAICTLYIECVNEPLKGFKLVLHYDPQKVYISYDELVDYGSSVNFVIRFYNRDILSRLHNHTASMLRLA